MLEPWPITEGVSQVQSGDKELEGQGLGRTAEAQSAGVGVISQVITLRSSCR